MVVKCGYEGSSRRVNFPSASTCRLDSVRLRVSYMALIAQNQDKLMMTGRGMLPPVGSIFHAGLYR